MKNGKNLVPLTFRNWNYGSQKNKARSYLHFLWQERNVSWACFFFLPPKGQHPGAIDKPGMVTQTNPGKKKRTEPLRHSTSHPTTRFCRSREKDRHLGLRLSPLSEHRELSPFLDRFRTTVHRSKGALINARECTVWSGVSIPPRLPEHHSQKERV